MTRKLVWALAVAVAGMVWVDLARSLRQQRRRAEKSKELSRWEGEGGQVPNARSAANS